MNMGMQNKILGTVIATAAVLLVVGVWRFWPRTAVMTAGDDAPPRSLSIPLARLPESAAPASQPVELAAQTPTQDDRHAAQPLAPKPAPPPASAPAAPPRDARIDAALALEKQGNLIEARHELNRLLTDADAAHHAAIRAELQRLADETVFSPRRVVNDPLSEMYTVRAGDVLVNIAKPFEVPAESIMLVNQIKDPTKLRVGQRLKAPRGPFHAKIHSAEHRMDLYLRDVYVRSYPVGLGQNGTPTGVWLVDEKLRNALYYPPESDAVKKVMYPNDPDYPLGVGGLWIALEGIEGAAVGQKSFGIHGTNEPQSIGKNESLGCVRMIDSDVAVVFKLLEPRRSKVTVLP